MTWREVIARGGDYIVARGVDDGRAAVEFLAARLLRTGRGLLGPRLGEEPGETFLAAMRRGVRRLADGEPVQYVIGEWDFRSLTLKCDRRALIPRPETEGLVGLVLEFLNARPASSRPPLVVDVGTGTGAIILSLASEYKRTAAFIGTDISADALALARENAALTGLDGKVRFVAMDGLDDFDEPGMIDVIVSNPPYISNDEFAGLDRRVRSFEPPLALMAGKTGVEFYERYIDDAMNLLAPGGAVFFEIGATQGAAVKALLDGYGFIGATVKRDLAGQDRYVFATLK